MAKGAHLTFTLAATGLKPRSSYGLRFEWHTAGGDIEGGIGAQTADLKGRVTFELEPTILVAIGHHEAPGTLTLAVTDASGSDVGGAYTIVEPVA